MYNPGPPNSYHSYITGFRSMERYARITGYAAALVILLGALALVMNLREGLLFPHHRVQVRFPTIGTLMEDDPVKVRGVPIGRVASIRAGEGGAIATLEFFHRTPIPADSRFINFNYSLFGARMVILVPGTSREPMDGNRIQAGVFSTGVTETIHRVEELLTAVSEYKRLSLGLERGTDSSMSVQQFLARRVYPVLEEFGTLVRDMDTLQDAAGAQLDRLESAVNGVDRLSRGLASQNDTLVVRAERTLGRLALLTAQATTVLRSLEEIAVAAQDTSRGPGRALMRRDLYDRALSVTHSLEDLLKVLREDGLSDAIHFWRNVNIRWRKKD
jgi:phospholipid/cholesterol/gamma-HCH transport system substrate-binding protein